jgi:hypothetical protein
MDEFSFKGKWMNPGCGPVRGAMKELGCSLDDLAHRLGMSRSDLENVVNSPDAVPVNVLKGIGDLREDARIMREHPELVQWAGSPIDARYWESLISTLAHGAVSNYLAPLHPSFCNFDDTYIEFVIETLTKIGVVPPKTIPSELRCYINLRGLYADYEAEKKPEHGAFARAVSAYPYARTIGNVFFVLNTLWAFYAMHVRDAVDDQAGSAFDTQMCIEANMFDLAATMIEVDEAFAPDISGFRCKVRADYGKWLATIENSTLSIGRAFQIRWMTDMVGIKNDPAVAATRSFDHYLETASA